jgi:PleD family two-component response regulator
VAEFKVDRMRTTSQFIAEADKALYHSKEQGRNRVTVQK